MRGLEEMLDRHDVPYFHMKEMAKPKGVFANGILLRSTKASAELFLKT